MQRYCKQHDVSKQPPRFYCRKYSTDVGVVRSPGKKCAFFFFFFFAEINAWIASSCFHQQPWVFCYVIIDELLLAENTAHTCLNAKCVGDNWHRASKTTLQCGVCAPPSVTETKKLSVHVTANPSAPDLCCLGGICHFKDPLFRATVRYLRPLSAKCGDVSAWDVF